MWSGFAYGCGAAFLAIISLQLCLFKFLKPTGVGVAIVVRFTDNDMVEQDNLHQFARR